MVQAAAGVYEREDSEDLYGMDSLVRTALQYLSNVSRDYYAVDVRTVLTNARTDPSALDGWQIIFDGGHPMANEGDFDYAETLPE
jgi:predicted metal-dependent hydrolase